MWVFHLQIFLLRGIQSDISYTRDKLLIFQKMFEMKLFKLLQIIYQGNLAFIQWLLARGLIKDILFMLYILTLVEKVLLVIFLHYSTHFTSIFTKNLIFVNC